MESADEVLALRGIDAGLAADRGIDLRQQRGRDLHKAHPAPQDCRGKAGEIADNATAEGDDEIAALEPHLEQALAERSKLTEALRRLAGLQDDGPGVQVLALQRRFETRKVKARDVLVRHNPALGRAESRGDEGARVRQQARSDQNVVGAAAQRHRHCAGGRNLGHRGHCASSDRADGSGAVSRSMISATITSCGTSRLSTVRSACA